MKLNRIITLCAVTAALAWSVSSAFAQDNGGDNGGAGRRNAPGGGNFDPAQMQQRMMERIQESMGFTNDTDWNAVQPLVQKVMDARRDTMSGMFGAFRRGGRNGGGNGGPEGQSNPEREALQQAVDSGAPAAQIKSALDKYRTAQKAKQAKLEQAQADLKAVLSQKQEAAAVLMGLLN